MFLNTAGSYFDCSRSGWLWRLVPGSGDEGSRGGGELRDQAGVSRGEAAVQHSQREPGKSTRHHPRAAATEGENRRPANVSHVLDARNSTVLIWIFTVRTEGRQTRRHDFIKDLADSWAGLAFWCLNQLKPSSNLPSKVRQWFVFGGPGETRIFIPTQISGTRHPAEFTHLRTPTVLFDDPNRDSPNDKATLLYTRDVLA